MEKKQSGLTLTPATAKKILDNVQASLMEKDIAKKHVLHHLKQLKAQMGKAIKAEQGMNVAHCDGIRRCMIFINHKIAKIKNQ